jgi:hypothetical protein
MKGRIFLFNKLNAKFRLSKFSKERSGVILIIVLWVLVILSALAISLGRKTSIELALAKNAIGKVRAKFISWAGVVYAINQIYRDTQDSSSFKKDTFAYCGIKENPDVSLEDLFSHREVGSGFFEIVYNQYSDESEVMIEEIIIGNKYSGNRSVDIVNQQGPFMKRKSFYGFSDEERKININGITKKDYNILSELILSFGYQEEKANIISASIVDWTDGDDTITGGEKGAENAYYEGLERPYRSKNTYFDVKEELLLVRGMTKEIYYAIEDYVTVFPRGGSLQINFETATAPVLRALARAMAKAALAEEVEADSLVEKLLAYRRGDDGAEQTADDNIISFKEVATNAVERNIFLAMNRYRTKVSQFFNIHVAGVDRQSGAQSAVEAIVARDDYTLVRWKRR